MYDPAELTVGPAFLTREDETKPLRNRILQEQYGYNTEEEYRDMLARYLGNVSLVDYYVGEILDTLRTCGIDDNTIIVFTSDHGEMMGDHSLRGKTVMYGQAVKVPLLLRVPEWGCEQRFVDQPVSQVDLVPTLLELMGCSAPEHLEGYSLVPFLTGQGPLQEEDVFIEWQGPDGYQYMQDAPWPKNEQDKAGLALARTVVTPEGWKLTLRRDDLSELYNLPDDPNEMNNLYGQPQSREIEEELTAKIRAWQKRTADPANI